VGWQIHEWPALCIEPLPGKPDGVPLPSDFDLAVFVSGNAAACYFGQLRAQGIDQWPTSCTLAAIGPATASHLRASGRLSGEYPIVHPAADAPRHDSEALWDCLVARGPIPRRVLLIRGTKGRDWLAEQLREQGAVVHAHAVYRRAPARWSASRLDQLAQWVDIGHHPIWLLTSGESIEAVRANVAQVAPVAWWQGCHFIVTHGRLVPRLELPTGWVEQAVSVCVPAEEAIFNVFVSSLVASSRSSLLPNTIAS
jgi:uroporphyrinogen-III synthase